MVTSQEIQKTVKGYRGSKSITGLNKLPACHNKSVTVKEQRVDGSCTKQKSKALVLRCILKNFVRSSIIVKNLSNQLIKRNYTTQISLSKESIANSQIFNPWFITGFTDAEGSFVISLVKDLKTKTGWNILVRFKIDLHKKDLFILEGIQKYFGGKGRIASTGKNRESFSFVVSSRKEISAFIIPHFDRYPLISQKKGWFWVI